MNRNARSARRARERAPSLPEPTDLPLDVTYEDASLLVLNKAPGVLVHPVRAGQRDTLANGVAHHLVTRGEHAGVHAVHRLDRDTSGLVLFAKHASVHAALDAQLRARTLRRTYLAFARGVIPQDDGVIDAPIGPHARSTNLRAVSSGGEDALTRYRVLERYAHATLVQLELDSGRTHQVRVHLQHLGFPIVGDAAYGGGRGWVFRQALHATRIAFAHPVTREALAFESPLPGDLRRVQAALREGRVPPA